MIVVTVILYIGGFLIGASLGSFIGCAIYRVPRRISLIKGRSACPGCGHQLTSLELIPVFSFLFQRERSRCCGKPLARAYLWAELICGLSGLVLTYFLMKNFIAI